MNNSLELFRRAQSFGLQLEADGGDLIVKPARRCPSDFAETLRAHKSELLDWLEARDAGLAPDCQPWLHVAKQVLAGEFDGCDSSTGESLKIGLRSVTHPICKQALGRLRIQQEKPA
jgi:hypothetical protein